MAKWPFLEHISCNISKILSEIIRHTTAAKYYQSISSWQSKNWTCMLHHWIKHVNMLHA